MIVLVFVLFVFLFGMVKMCVVGVVVVSELVVWFGCLCYGLLCDELVVVLGDLLLEIVYWMLIGWVDVFGVLFVVCDGWVMMLVENVVLFVYDVLVVEECEFVFVVVGVVVLVLENEWLVVELCVSVKELCVLWVWIVKMVDAVRCVIECDLYDGV